MTAGGKAFDLTIALTYYRPYVSGLSEYARLVAEGLVDSGLRVAIATTRFRSDLPAYEIHNGVEIHRTPVLAKVNKGVVSPMFARDVLTLAEQSRVLNIHLPLLEAGFLAGRTKAPVVTTYHCDIELEGSVLNAVVSRVTDISSLRAFSKSDRVVFSSLDYANHSRVGPGPRDKVSTIRPPFESRVGGQPTFRDSPGVHVGFVGRVVAEKGLPHLIRAFGLNDGPDRRLLLAGDYSGIAGGSIIKEIRPLIDGDERIRLLGYVPDSKMADFYASIDVLALPSTSSLEAYGIVQLEAMSAGVPVVASDRPGVRIPVSDLGFGTLVDPNDHISMASALDAMAAKRDPARGRQLAHDLEASDPVSAYGQLVETLDVHSRLHA